MLTAREYHQTLPAKRMGAGALLWDQAGAYLIVEPVYKDLWEIPGGVVEALESPLSAVLRELQEELGLFLQASDFSLCSIDYLYESDLRTEGLMFLFLGPILGTDQISKIRLAETELRSYRFVSLDEADRSLGKVLGARMRRAVEGLQKGTPVYWEDRSAE